MLSSLGPAKIFVIHVDSETHDFRTIRPCSGTGNLMLFVCNLYAVLYIFKNLESLLMITLYRTVENSWQRSSHIHAVYKDMNAHMVAVLVR